MKKSIKFFIATIVIATFLPSCGNSGGGGSEKKEEVNPLSYVYVNNETDSEHYEVYYNGKTNLPAVTNIPSSYNDGTHGEHSVTGFYYNESEDKGAFENCESLRDINVPNSITSISQKAFKGCIYLTSFDLDYDSQLTSVGKEAFYNCTCLTYFRVTPELKVIEDYAFSLCSSMVSLLDYDYCQLESIGKQAFINDYSLYTVPKFNSLKTIGSHAFSRCHALDMVMLPSIESIDEGAFYKCHNLETFQFGRTCTIEKISKECFFECRSLVSIAIPYKVNTIEDYAFGFCSSLNYIEGALYVKNIGKYAFQSCSSLPSAPINSLCISIGKEAFKDCTSLSEVTLPSTLTSLGVSTFNGCRNLKSITVDVNNPYYDSRDNCNAVISKVDIAGEEDIPANTLIAACPATNIPHSVTNIVGGCFLQFHGAKKIVIPNSISSVSSFFIASCDDLEEVEFESGSTIKAFVTDTLRNLGKLKSVILPDSLELLKTCSLNYLSIIEEITLPTSIKAIESNAINYAYELSIIHYGGTKEQFNSIQKGEGWVNKASESLVVRCSDGDIPIAS